MTRRTQVLTLFLGCGIFSFCYLIYNKVDSGIILQDTGRKNGLQIVHGQMHSENTATVSNNMSYNVSIPMKKSPYVANCLTGDLIYKYNDKFIKQKIVLESYKESFRMYDNSEGSNNRQKSFIGVYSNFSWGKDIENNKSVHSGPGSLLKNAQEAMGVLHTVVNFIKQKTGKTHITMLDIPCGDMTWMSRFLKTRDDIYYTGIDIVPEAIENHKKNYKDEIKWKFINADIVHENATISKYDLIFSRMMMQHLYHIDVMKILMKISDSGSEYVLMTSHTNTFNAELAKSNIYRYRELNLQLNPYKLTPPLCISRDGLPANNNHHSLALWQLPLYFIKDCKTIQYIDSRKTLSYPACGIE